MMFEPLVTMAAGAVESADVVALTLNAMFGLLCVPRRRYVLYHLFDERGVLTIDDIARHVAARERGVPPDAVSEADHQRVVVSLVHNHLPRLAEHGIVDYDCRSGDVVLSYNADFVEPHVESARACECPSATEEVERRG